MKRKNDWTDNFYIALAFVLMGILYYSSSMSYEDQTIQPVLGRWLSGEPLRGVLESVQFTYADNSISIDSLGYASFIEFFVRKGAHFFSYFLLGLFWFMGLRNKVSNLAFAALLAVLLSAGYASFDELHQSFQPNRTALLEDVLLDTAGALTGALLTWFVSNRRTRKKGRWSLSSNRLR